MQLIFAKDGKTQEAVELSMRQLWHMGWKFCMKSKRFVQDMEVIGATRRGGYDKGACAKVN